MKTITVGICGFATLLVAVAWAADDVGLVTVRGIHLSCDACVTDSQASLKEVAGISDAKADLNGRSLTFKARDEKSAQAGIKALAEHGFFGKAAFGNKDLAFPDHDIKKGEKRDSITFIRSPPQLRSLPQVGPRSPDEARRPEFDGNRRSRKRRQADGSRHDGHGRHWLTPKGGLPSQAQAIRQEMIRTNHLE